MPAPRQCKSEMGVKKVSEEQVTSIKMENGPELEEMSERDEVIYDMSYVEHHAF